MSDEALIHFASEDGPGLTAEAFGILKDEFVTRNLPMDVITAIEDGTFSAQRESVTHIENMEMREFSSTVLAHALNEKRDGKSNAAIVAGLVETGMDEQQAELLISQLQRHAEALLAKSNNNLLTGVFICIAGLAIHLISPQKPFVTLMDILSICAIGWGIIMFLKNLFDKNKYAAVIRNINVTDN